MPHHVYRSLEITGSSKTFIEEAVENAAACTGQSVHGLRWFEAKDIRRPLVDGSIYQWQLSVKVGFTGDA